MGRLKSINVISRFGSKARNFSERFPRRSDIEHRSRLRSRAPSRLRDQVHGQGRIDRKPIGPSPDWKSVDVFVERGANLLRCRFIR